MINSISTDSLDPYDPNLTSEQKKAIIERAKNDAVYYLTKIITPTIRMSPDPDQRLVDAKYTVIDGLRVLLSISTFSIVDGQELTVTELFRPQPEKEKRITAALCFYKAAVSTVNKE